MSDQKYVNLHGPLNYTGMGNHFFHWVKALIPQLVQRGIETTVVPLHALGRAEFNEEHHAGEMAMFAEALGNQATMVHNPDVGIMCWHPHQLSQFAGKVRIGYTVFETTELRPEEKHHLSQCDYVAVPTNWHRQMLIDQDMDDSKILVWPEGVDHRMFMPIPMEHRLDPQIRGPLHDASSDFTFLHIGKFEKRKSSQMLLQAFATLATNMKDDDRRVKLLLHCFNPYINNPNGRWMQTVATAIQEAGFGNPEVLKERHVAKFTHDDNPDFTIELIGGWLQNPSDIMALYRAADAAVFPYCAEGWNLPLIEAMACGLPSAATFYSGPTEYLSKPDDLAVPNEEIFVPITEGTMMIARDNVFFHGAQGDWFQPHPDATVAAMTKLLDMAPGEFRNMGEAAASIVRNNWNWQKSARTALDSLIELELIR